MKILSVLSSSDHSFANQRMERVFGRLREAGHEIHAVLPDAGPVSPLLRSRGIHVHLHPGLSVLNRNALHSFRNRVRFALGLPASVVFLTRLIHRQGIDVIHTNTLTLPTPSLAAWISRKPHIWHVRELLSRHARLWPLYQRWIHHFSSAIVAVSACTRGQFQPLRQRRIKILYDGLDTDTTIPDIIHVAELRELFPPDACLIGVVGPIEWLRTGQEVLIRAASILKDKHPSARFLIAGSPANSDQQNLDRLRELIATYSLEDIFHVFPDPLFPDPVSILAALDVAVFPFIVPEPFGSYVLEAMAVGTPIVGSRACGLSEQVLDGVTGLLFPPGDESKLANDLDLLLRDRSLRDRMGEAGRLRVRTNFSFEQTCHSMDILLEQVTGSHS